MMCLNRCGNAALLSNEYCSAECGVQHRRKKAAPLQPIGSFSVLSDPDRKIIDETRQWLSRFILELEPRALANLPGVNDQNEQYRLVIDGLERGGLYDLLQKLDDLAARTSGEPQLFRNSITGGDGGA